MFSFLQELLALQPSGEPITLAGYSTGSIVALEMTYLLEAAGYQVKLILLDGSPYYLQALCKALNIGETDDEIQNSVISSVHNVLAPGPGGEELREQLKIIPDWDAKLVYAKSKVPEDVTGHSEKHQMAIMVDLYNRVRNVIDYKVESTAKIQSHVTLVKPNEQTIGGLLDEDYFLSRICEHPVDIAYVDGNHLSMLDNPETAKLISAVHNKNPKQKVSSKVGNIDGTFVEQQAVDLAKAH